MTSTLYRGGHVRTPDHPAAPALLVRGGAVAWSGPEADLPDDADIDSTVDLDGALVTPAFVDAHVHATSTGVTLRGLDLTGARTRREALDRVAAHATPLPDDAVVLGHGWDESGWPDRTPPTPADLDRAAGGRRVYLSRVDMHSCVVSAALLTAAKPDT